MLHYDGIKITNDDSKLKQIKIPRDDEQNKQILWRDELNEPVSTY